MEIAIVGTGKVAERNYIPSLLRHDDVSLTLYSRTRERSDALGERFDVPVAGSLDELLARGSRRRCSSSPASRSVWR